MMTVPHSQSDPKTFYSERYTQLVRYEFVGDQPSLRDDGNDGSQMCRFCGRGKPDVSFCMRAHAVPEFLGNRSLLSMNECDECNKFLADNYEDHLGKWSLYARALSQVERKHRTGKSSRPTYKDPTGSVRIESPHGGLHIHLSDPAFKSQLQRQEGPFDLLLPTDGMSQPYVPIRAAKALLKIACSVCPLEELDQCRPAIEWLMGRNRLSLSMFPVLYAFSPGRIASEAGEVLLLRRRTEDPIPYLWGIVSFANHRLQFFVPLCPADSGWFRIGERTQIDCTHYPTRFGADWQFGKTEYGVLDWSGTEPIRRSASVTLRLIPVNRSATSTNGNEL